MSFSTNYSSWWRCQCNLRPRWAAGFIEEGVDRARLERRDGQKTRAATRILDRDMKFSIWFDFHCLHDLLAQNNFAQPTAFRRPILACRRRRSIRILLVRKANFWDGKCAQPIRAKLPTSWGLPSFPQCGRCAALSSIPRSREIQTQNSWLEGASAAVISKPQSDRLNLAALNLAHDPPLIRRATHPHIRRPLRRYQVLSFSYMKPAGHGRRGSLDGFIAFCHLVRQGYGRRSYVSILRGHRRQLQHRCLLPGGEMCHQNDRPMGPKIGRCSLLSWRPASSMM